MIPAELRRRPGRIEIPRTVSDHSHDLVVIGSPDLVVVDERPDPLVPPIGDCGGKRSRALLSQPWWLPTLWEAQPQDGASSRSRTGRQIGGRTSLHARRGPGAVPDVPDQLCGVRRIPRALPGRDDPASNLRDEQLDRSELRVSRIRPATSRTLLNVADTRVAARRRNVLCASGLWSWREARQPTNPASCVR